MTFSGVKTIEPKIQPAPDEIPSFDVLNREENIHRHLLLEASAGTGKTFAIENIVARLLIESDGAKEPLKIENILVVTFTRMAARELKERIHANLERSLELIKSVLSNNDVGDHCPDYLLAHLERGEPHIRKIRKAIESALLSFDRAQIFTIHGFCWRMLKSYSIEAKMGLNASSTEGQSLSVAQLMLVIRDFLRKGLEELNPSHMRYSPKQLHIIMKRVRNQSEKLQRDLFREITRGMPIFASPSFDQSLRVFQKTMEMLTSGSLYKGQKILEDFELLAPSYKGLRDAKKQIHVEKLEKAKRFAALFDKREWQAEDLDLLIEDGVFFLEVFAPDLLMAKAKPIPDGSLHYPDFLNALKKHLEPVVEGSRNEAVLFSRLASDCQQFVQSYQEREELLHHQELLLYMRKALEAPEFVKCIRTQYGAALVDEFQDTDPVQWEIFSRLFVPDNQKWPGYLYLVGDPKQSIYAFRQADIYTYLSAADRLGPGALAVLKTNFRSQPSLVNALNKLFSSSCEPFSLPKRNFSIPYHIVKAGKQTGNTLPEAPLHFWEVRHRSKSKSPLREIEKDVLLPTIVKAILRLQQDNGAGFGQFAILISDKYQAERVAEYLKTFNIPIKQQRGKDLNHSSVVDEMRDLLNGILHYRSRSALNIALAGRLIGMQHQELLLLENEQHLISIIEKCHQLKMTFDSRGFAGFYQDFMESVWHADRKSVLERLLHGEEGITFYREWQDLADLILEEESAQPVSIQRVLSFLDAMEMLSLDDEEKTKTFLDAQEDGVSILTSHVSKGLEFDTVFALGLTSRTKSPEDSLVPLEISKDDRQVFVLGTFKGPQDPAYQKYCEEHDAEKLRLLYVALTRAKTRLYVPFIIDEGNREVKTGCASPIDLFLAKLDKPSIDYLGLYKRISSEGGAALAEFAAKFPSIISHSILEANDSSFLGNVLSKTVELIPPPIPNIPERSSVIQSFTSLTQSKIIQAHEGGGELSVPHHFHEEIKTEHTLPSGNETGILLHKIFEMLPFHQVKACTSFKDVRPLILPFLKDTPFATWEDVIAKIVFQTLTTPLTVHFCLADLNPKKIYREMEFLYPYHPHQGLLQDTPAKSGFLKGVVDLFFEHQGKFYIVDWKSNWLGPSQDYYQRCYMEEAMRSNCYTLQASIYKEAFKRYLNLVEDGDFNKLFGGVYYLFIRGISTTTGIFHLADDNHQRGSES